MVFDRLIVTYLSRCDIGSHVSEEVLVEGLPDLHEIIGDGPLRVAHGVVVVGAGDDASGGVIGRHQVLVEVPFPGSWLKQMSVIYDYKIKVKWTNYEIGYYTISWNQVRPNQTKFQNQ